jgi:antitoxin component of RelBE/YafQ-DinJ toxin-antitoxin module
MVKKDTEVKFRIDSHTLEAAKVKAERLDVPLSQILRQLLRGWIKDDPPTDEQEGEQLPNSE